MNTKAFADMLVKSGEPLDQESRDTMARWFIEEAQDALQRRKRKKALRMLEQALYYIGPKKSFREAFEEGAQKMVWPDGIVGIACGDAEIKAGDAVCLNEKGEVVKVPADGSFIPAPKRVVAKWEAGTVTPPFCPTCHESKIELLTGTNWSHWKCQTCGYEFKW